MEISPVFKKLYHEKQREHDGVPNNFKTDTLFSDCI